MIDPMRTPLFFPVALVLGLVACGGGAPPPSDRLATAEAGARSARELGADKNPNAMLHLRLADEQIAQAKKLMADGENKRADLVLQRAGADAELSVMLAKQTNARGEADKAQERLQNIKAGK